MPPLDAAAAMVSAHMDQIKRLFKSGVKITVLVRTPGEPGRDFLMTDDDLDEAITALRRRRDAGKTR